MIAMITMITLITLITLIMNSRMIQDLMSIREFVKLSNK